MKLDEKEIDIFDWSLKQMAHLGYISQKQLFFISRILLMSRGRIKRFSDKEIEKYWKRFW